MVVKRSVLLPKDPGTTWKSKRFPNEDELGVRTSDTNTVDGGPVRGEGIRAKLPNARSGYQK